MAYIAEIKKGATVQRFRAYAADKMTRKPSAQDHFNRAKAGKPRLPPGTRISYGVEQVAIEGDVTGLAVTIDATEIEVTRVAFYAGPVEEEVCVGSVEIGAAGMLEIELHSEPGEPKLIDEQDL